MGRAVGVGIGGAPGGSLGTGQLPSARAWGPVVGQVPDEGLVWVGVLVGVPLWGGWAGWELVGGCCWPPICK